MQNHSFVIRLWLEEAESAERRAQWRGHITHYPSQADRYFDDLAVITGFVRECMGGARPQSGSRRPPHSAPH